MEQSWQKSKTVSGALWNAGRGVGEAARGEWKLKIAVVCTILAILLAFILDLSGVAFAIIILLSASIIATEMVNSALETFLDSVYPQYNESARRAKDLAAGAVLVLSIAAALIALILFLPPLRNFLVY